MEPADPPRASPPTERGVEVPSIRQVAPTAPVVVGRAPTSIERHRDVITQQTKTRDRVRDLAEVYTAEREVNAMLDLIPDMFPSVDDPDNVDRKFLEPACGAGNFLVAILERKLAFITRDRFPTTARLELAVLRAISSIYGIDIDASNVTQSRGFMKAEVAHHLNTAAGSGDFWAAVETILQTNVIRADALADAKQIMLVDYQWQRKPGYVRRVWSPLEEARHQPAQDTLFEIAAVEQRADATSIHYRHLAALQAPTAIDLRGKP